MCAGVTANTTPAEVEDNFQESVLSFYNMTAWDRSQVVRLGSRCFYPLSPLTGAFEASSKDLKMAISRASPSSSLKR